MVFTSLAIISVVSSSSIQSFGGDNLCIIFWFTGSFYMGHKITGGFGIAFFRFISLIHQETFFKFGASFFIKVIATFQVMFYTGK